MSVENIKPTTITDIFDNAESYIDEMRQQGDGREVMTELLCFVLGYFEDVKMGNEVIETLAYYAVDKIYKIAALMSIADNYTYAFFEALMPTFWKAIQNRGVNTFYILDNVIREDRFQLTLKLYSLSRFSVVTPYNGTVNNDLVKNVKEKTYHLVVDPRLTYDYYGFEVVDAQIKAYMESTQNIIYVEKDSRVNYIDKVKEMGRNSNYLCVFRNQAPTNPEVEIVRSRYGQISTNG